MKDEFFIGWQDSPPSKFLRTAKKYYLATLTMAVLLAIIYVVSQQGFKDSSYQIGKITEITGTYYATPKPNIVTQDQTPKVIFLTGKGKFGAEETVKNWEDENGTSLDGKLLDLKGTTAKYDGITFLELALKEASISLKGGTSTHSRIIEEHSTTLELTGEVVDPKCFFGAMKPGFGKIHKSCAIRCLSGGIPPVVVSEKNDYFILLLPENTTINSIFSYVGKKADLSGSLRYIDDIGYFTLAETGGIQANNTILMDKQFAICKN